MVTLKIAKNYLRVDTDEDDNLIASLISSSKELVEDIIREKLNLEEELPEVISNAILLLVGTLYEERQVSNDPKNSISIKNTLDTIRRMLFAYRKESF